MKSPRAVIAFRGFSLVEMLATMAVGAIVLLAAVNLLSSSGSGYDRGAGGVSAEREGRAALTQIADDLSKAVWQEDTVLENGGAGQSWKQGKVSVFSLQPKDAQSDEGRIGDLCAVGYSIRDLTVGGATVRCLVRSFRESEDTFTALKSGDTTSLFTPRDEDEPIAFGIIAFEVAPVSRSSSGKWEDWTRTADTTTGPDAVRVKLVIARRELIGKMSNATDWSSNPLLEDPTAPEKNRYLEVYEVIQRFGNDG